MRFETIKKINIIINIRILLLFLKNLLYYLYKTITDTATNKLTENYRINNTPLKLPCGLFTDKTAQDFIFFNDFHF